MTDQETKSKKRRMNAGAALAILGMAAVVVCAVVWKRFDRRSVDAPLDVTSAARDMSALRDLCMERKWTFHTASSYDRSGGNEDKGQYLKVLPNGNGLVMEAEGPGCVQRFWATGCEPGERMSFFFDGETTPRIDTDVDRINYDASWFPFVPPYVHKREFVSYVPIPFSRSLRIEAKAHHPIYYQVTWNEFPRGRQVASFPARLSEAESNALVSAGREWVTPPDGKGDAGIKWVEESKAVLQGQKARFSLSGAGVMRVLSIGFDLPPAARITEYNEALRRSMIRIYWNGGKSPSVAVPLGPFFCNFWRPVTYNSQPLASSNRTYECRFPMPFAGGAVIEVENGAAGPADIRVRAGIAPFPEGEARGVRYFHAGWSSSMGTKEKPSAHTVLKVRGKGHYVGCGMTVESAEGNWLILEGDDTIRVDGERVPSELGTGLEDYFNAAYYYFKGVIRYPWYGMLEKIPCRTLQYRFQVADAVPFRRSVEVTFERGDRNTAAGRLESVAYWYMDRPTAVSEESIESRLDCGRCGMLPAEFMAQLLSVERGGCMADAQALCRQFLQDWPQSQYAGVVRLRMLQYGAAPEDRSELQSMLSAMAAGGISRDAAEARDLLMLQSDANAALVGFQSSTAARAYLDGKAIGSVSNFLSFAVSGGALLPGLHTLAFEVAPNGSERWLVTSIKGRDRLLGNYSDLSFYEKGWKVFAAQPAGWPQPAADAAGALPAAACSYAWEGLPRAPYVVMEPNSYVHMQAVPVVLIPPDPVLSQRAVYVVKTFRW